MDDLEERAERLRDALAAYLDETDEATFDVARVDEILDALDEICPFPEFRDIPLTEFRWYNAVIKNEEDN